jgi:hypothetical protein
MKRLVLILGGLALVATAARGADDYFVDRLDDALTVSAWQGEFRARLSGTLDLEGYHLQQPTTGLIYTDGSNLFNPRLTLFLDAQLGRQIYIFAQTRADRGFDPSDEGGQVRLDEYALRFTPGNDVRFNVQVGKFATVVGNWVQRHGSWDNPFITAPLPYENLTGIWNVVAARSDAILLGWAHVKPPMTPALEYSEKPLRTPIIWGPSYTTGAEVFGEIDRMKYAFEVKNGSLSSHPDTWTESETLWEHPTVSGRLGYQPNEMWDFGVSASTGPYLRPDVERTLPMDHGLGDYRQTVFGQDISFAWHHLQVWTEVYGARFAIPKVGNVDTLAYYAEAKYKFTPQFFGAVRWNQQLFSTVPDPSGGTIPWGRDAWRIDVAPGYRFTPHTEFKLQYSLEREDNAPRTYDGTIALQLVVRF